MDMRRLAYLLPQTGRQPAYGEFACDISRDIGLGGDAEDGADIDQRAMSALGAELGERRAGAMRVAEQVGFNDPAEGIRRHRLEPAEGEHGRAVDPDIDTAERRDC